MSSGSDLAQLEMAYRSSRRTVIGHLVFIVVCCGITLYFRRMMGFPPLLSGVIFIVAALVFGRDIMKFMALRSELSRVRAGRKF